MQKLDAHIHFWHFDPVEYGWIPDAMSSIQKDRQPDDVAPEYEKHGVEGGVAVQARQNHKETEYLINLARHSSIIKGVVGWVDFCNPGSGEIFKQWSQYPELVGFRHVVQDEPDNEFLLRKDFLKGVSMLDPDRFTYDILVFEKQLPAAIKFAGQLPDHRLVLDHIGKPDIINGSRKAWEKQIQNLAALPNVFCKLSGIITEADWQNWQPESLIPYIKIILEHFGTERVMFGTDWPVCTVAGTLDDVFNLIHDGLGDLSANEQQQVFYNTCKNFYKL